VGAAAETTPCTGQRVVVLSPHLDDAVLSLGAAVARWVAQGRHVEVWTAFTDAPAGAGPPRRLAAFGAYRTRTAEDEQALAVLGARGLRLGFAERLWREPRPKTLAAAFVGPRTATGFTCLPRLADVVAALLETGAEVYAPLGIGQHVDHLEVALATLTAARRRGSWDLVRFYEDYYALEERFRRRHPVAARQPVPWWQGPSLAAPALTLALGLPAAVLPSRGLDRYLPEVRALPWRCTPLPVEGFEARKLDAVLRYTSQVPRLGGRRGLPAALRRSHRRHGGELVWSVVGTGVAGSTRDRGQSAPSDDRD
jgi:LmbE family N-acetylglucosaminyl deacetylase